MISNTRLSYKKLTHEAWFEDECDDYQLRERVIGREKSWPKIKKAVHIKRRFRVKIPSLRRKTRALIATWTKVLKRLKESQSHFGDLFAGNYLFMQVTPTPLKLKYVVDHKSFESSHGGALSYYVPRISQ